MPRRVDSVTNTSLAAGAGAQLELGAWALRAEYERFNVAGGNPGLAGLAGLAATWSELQIILPLRRSCKRGASGEATCSVLG
jgi:hypothetical protein